MQNQVKTAVAGESTECFGGQRCKHLRAHHMLIDSRVKPQSVGQHTHQLANIGRKEIV